MNNVIRTSCIAFSILIASASVRAEFVHGSYQLRAHSSDLNQIEKPASIMYVDSEENSYIINAAISTWFINPEWSGEPEFQLALESHKNTTVKKEQDTQSIKAAGFYDWEDICLLHACFDSLHFKSTIELQADEIKANRSALAYLEFTALKDRLHLNSYGLNDPGTGWYISPIAGIEYENLYNSESAGEGSLFRSYLNLEFGIQPFDKLKNLSFIASKTFWRAFSVDDALTDQDRNKDLSKITLSWIFNKGDKAEVSLNLEWLEGENPRTKLADQEYFQIGLGIKI